MSFFDACPCCCRRDGLNTGGCLYCAARTYCAACGTIVACGCGRKIDPHACPNVTAVGTIEPVSMLVAAEVAPP